MIEPVTPDPPDWDRRVVLRQRWTELAYFHWAYEPDAVQRLLPDGIYVDTFDGQAWVGLIPFEMRKVQLGNTPAVPFFGDFIEVNVRTYVVDDQGRRAVWFWSLDVPRTAIVGVARTLFSLPYCWSACTHERSGERHRYTVRRRWPRPASPTSSDIRFTVADAIPADEIGDLEHFLTARWGLLATRRSTVLRGDVDHPRWPLHRVTDVEIDDSLVAAAGLPAPDGTPHGMYSSGVPVRVGWFERVGMEHA